MIGLAKGQAGPALAPGLHASAAGARPGASLPGGQCAALIAPPCAETLRLRRLGAPRLIATGAARLAAARWDLAPGLPRRLSLCEERGSEAAHMAPAQAPELTPFSGELPGDIEPSAHGLPYCRAAELFGAPDACLAQRRAVQAVWMHCHPDAALFAAVRAAVVAALKAGAQAPVLNLPVPLPRPAPLDRAQSIQAQRELEAKNADAEEAADGFSRLPEAATRLLEAERARRASFRAGLQMGVLQAFGRVHNRRGPWSWIAPEQWRPPASLESREDGCLFGGGLAYYDVHVHDRIGQEIEVARLAYGPAELVRDLENAMSEGAGVHFLDWDGMRRAAVLWRLIEEALADDVAAGLLIADGLPASACQRDPWTGKWPEGQFTFSLLSLPPPALSVHGGHDAAVHSVSEPCPGKNGWALEEAAAVLLPDLWKIVIDRPFAEEFKALSVNLMRAFQRRTDLTFTGRNFKLSPVAERVMIPVHDLLEAGIFVWCSIVDGTLTVMRDGERMLFSAVRVNVAHGTEELTGALEHARVRQLMSPDPVPASDLVALPVSPVEPPDKGGAPREFSREEFEAEYRDFVAQNPKAGKRKTNAHMLTWATRHYESPPSPQWVRERTRALTAKRQELSS